METQSLGRRILKLLPNKPETPSNKEAWFNADEKNSSAIRTHNRWAEDTLQSCLNTLAGTNACRDKVKEELAQSCSNELKILETRRTALKLVLGSKRQKEGLSVSGTSAAQPKVEGELAASSPKTSTESESAKTDDKQEDKKDNKATPAHTDDKQEDKKDTKDEAGGPGKGAYGKVEREDISKPPSPCKSSLEELAAGTGVTPIKSKQSTVGKLVDEVGSHQTVLLKYIASFGDGSSSFGNNPPCRSYRSLVLIEYFDEVPNTLKGCSSQAEIAAVTKQDTIFKQALKDLLNRCKGAISRLENATKQSVSSAAEKKRAALDNAASAKKKAKVKPSTASRSSFFDFAHAMCTALESILLDTDNKPVSEPDWMKPVMLRLAPESSIYTEGTHAANCANQFFQQFQQDPARADPGRAQRRCPYLAMGDLKKFMSVALPLALSGDRIKNNEADLNPAAFAVAKQRLICSAEPGDLTSIRIQYRGTRQVVLVPTNAVMMFISHIEPGASVPTSRVYEWIKTANPESLNTFQDFIAAPCFHHGSLGLGDILFTPAGWCFYELICNMEVIGIRCPLLAPVDIKPRDTLNQRFQALGKPVDILVRALALLAMA